MTNQQCYYVILPWVIELHHLFIIYYTVYDFAQTFYSNSNIPLILFIFPRFFDVWLFFTQPDIKAVKMDIYIFTFRNDTKRGTGVGKKTAAECSIQ